MKLFKRSLENPSTPISAPALWLYEALGARSSTSGISVSPETALESSAIFAGVRLISSTMASLPLATYRGTEAGKEKARKHPLWRILHDRPNPEQTAFTFRETMMAWLLLWGNAYAEIERNNRGEPVALWPLHPGLVRMDRTSGGRKIYLVRVEGQEVPLAAEDVLHIPGISLDGHTGLFPVQLARNTIGLAKATEEYAARFFSNSATPSGAIKVPGNLTKEQEKALKKNWDAQQGGLTNAQRIAILSNGMEFQPFAFTAEQSQFLEQRKFSVTEVARILGLPPHLIGDLDRATFSNIEAQQIHFVQYCILPWARRWEQTINAALFGDGEYFAEFTLEGLLRGDSKSRAEFYTALFNLGALSPNDIRELENLNRIEGGDRRFRPLNMAPLDAPPDPAQDAARSLIDAEVGRYQRRFMKHSERGNIDAEWLERQREILEENIGPALEALGHDADAYIDEVLSNGN